MKKLICGAIITMASLLFPFSACHAIDNGNGVVVETYDFPSVYKIHSEWFTAYDPKGGAWQAINSTEHTAATATAVSVPVTTYFDAVRAGVLVSESGTDSVTIEADFISTKRR